MSFRRNPLGKSKKKHELGAAYTIRFCCKWTLEHDFYTLVCDP